MRLTTIFGTLGSALVLGVAVQAARAAQIVARSFAPQRGVAQKPTTGALSEAQEFEAATPDGPNVRGWRTRSTNGAAVLLVHPGPNRSELVREADALAQAGYGVFLFDLLGRGESDDPSGDFYAGWRAAISTVVDLATIDPTIDPRRIGGFGYSCGAALIAEAAALDPRLRAVVLSCGFADHDQQIRQDFGRWGIVSQWPALWAMHRMLRSHPTALRSCDNLKAIAPRPVLIVGAEFDSGVPPNSARLLFAAAEEPKELILLPGGGHGRLAELWPDLYLVGLRSFFDRTLAVSNTPN